ncbi:MAG: co-chaperone GroES [Candidatus Magasanikbacteria bacterium RIFOXYC12_FULL_33_11]|uniref:Co-chaperonin GroES n=1 Tax=Candidatus Magasanikbacteria bacterium RIFOXYC12_FULL_33_11 TaxID=1798701 RepID=A0A1F6NPC2_9BACT|nr:MAG: co-chaperone GroES [Candidatus Magasanikbacteria bacterium RIFOXYC12_FULL_33_11]
MNIRPLGDRLLVKPQVEEEKTLSGIILPETIDKEKKAQGEILALGNGEKLAKLDLAVGMKVLFKKWGGEEIKIGDVDYKILDHVDVIAVVE